MDWSLYRSNALLKSHQPLASFSTITYKTLCKEDTRQLFPNVNTTLKSQVSFNNLCCFSFGRVWKGIDYLIFVVHLSGTSVDFEKIHCFGLAWKVHKCLSINVHKSSSIMVLVSIYQLNFFFFECIVWVSEIHHFEDLYWARWHHNLFLWRTIRNIW